MSWDLTKTRLGILMEAKLIVDTAGIKICKYVIEYNLKSELREIIMCAQLLMCLAHCSRVIVFLILYMNQCYFLITLLHRLMMRK